MTGPTAEETEARKNVADADKAEADASKARAEAAKAAAEARAADAAARKAEAELAEYNGTAAREQREAASRKASAEAEQDAASARRAQLTALIPNFGEVKESTLAVKDDPPLFGTTLSFLALRTVAETVAKNVLDRLGGAEARILVTSDPDLASADAIYRDVTSGLAQLQEVARRLAADITKDLLDTTDALAEASKNSGLRTRTAGGAAGDRTRGGAGFLPTDWVAALATAVPGILSLLTAQRTITTAPSTVSELAATAAVMGALRDANGKGPQVVQDDLRVVPDGEVYLSSTKLSVERQALVNRKIELANHKRDTDAKLGTEREIERTLSQQLADAGKTPLPKVEAELRDVRGRIEVLTARSTDLVLRLGLVDSALASIDAFTGAIRVVPTGARRSAIATAALYEQLHQSAPAPSRFTHVLLVKPQAGQTQQVVDNRPLWFDDRFSTIGDMSITYILISTADSQVVGAGTITAGAEAHGKIGQKPEMSLLPVP